jgi:hypothetical protein
LAKFCAADKTVQEHPERMNLHLHLDVAQYTPRVRWFMAAAWVLIVAKCFLVWWAIGHWNVPIHPLWIVAPTVAFAALATSIWLTHHED